MTATEARIQSPLRHLFTTTAAHLRPRPRPPLSTWAEANIVLSSEYSRKATALRLYKWQREIFDAFTDPYVEDITVMCARQLVKTLMLQCALAYTIAEDPGPVMISQPNEDDAKAFSKERLTPMVRDCPALKGKISETEKDGNTILTKQFAGGSVIIVGAITPAKAARRTNRIVMFDEVDKYPANVGREGDFITIAVEGTQSFIGKRKLIKTCSPTIAGFSRIQKSYLASDRRKPYIPCHACGHMQYLKWAQVKWDSAIAEHLRPATAYYQCENKDCGAAWNDNQRWAACELTEWRAERPFVGKAGFWISHLYSPWKTLQLLVADWLDKYRDPQQLKSFINTVLGEVWEEEGTAPDPDVLYGRREDYPHTDNAVVPLRGLFLTAAVDVQENPARLECEVVAWGRGRERWSMGYYVIQAQASNGELLPVTSRELWDKLDQEVLSALYLHASGHHLPILCMCVDTGHRAKSIYDYCARHTRLSHGPAGIKLTAPRTVVPVKGNDDDLRIISAVSKEDAARKRQNVRIVSVGTHCVKQELFDLLKHLRPRPDGGPVPGCYHFPYYELGYFEGLASEVRVVHDDTGEVEYRKRPGARNEPIDCFDAATEVLTNQGWKPFSRIGRETTLATVNLKKDEIQFQKPTALTVRHHVGEMVEIKGRRIDILVTPNHRMVTYKKEFDRKIRKWRFDVPVKITLAKDLTIHHQLKMAASWVGDGKKTMTVPDSIDKKGHIISVTRELDAGDLAEFMGWFVAEGYACAINGKTKGHRMCRVVLCQNTGPKFDRIEALLKRLPWNWHLTRRAGKQFTFTSTNKQLLEFVSEAGRDAYTKRIPDWVKESGPDVIARFMDAAVLGDGWTQANHRTIATVSKELADGYQELFLKLGRACNIRVIQPKPCNLYNRPWSVTVPQYHVSEISLKKASLDGGSRGKRIYIGKSVPYRGMVYCATVPNGTLICRRNGLSFIAGNCAVYNRAAAAIVGIDRFTEAHWQRMEQQLGINSATGEVQAPPAILSENSQKMTENAKIQQNQPQNAQNTQNLANTAISRDTAPHLASALDAPPKPGQIGGLGQGRRVRGRF